MHDETNGRRCSWLIRLVLVGLIAVDALIIIGDVFRGERVALSTFGSAVAVIALCSLVWYGVPWGRWVLVAVVALRVSLVAAALVSSFEPGDVMRFGALAALLFYVAAAVVLASPLARPMAGAAT